MSHATSRDSTTTKGRVLHSAAGYDLMAWLLLLGRERAFRERLVRLARLEPGNTVLDVGCGTGSLAIIAKRRVGAGGFVHGVDASIEMIERAKKKARRAAVDVVFQTGVAEALPFPDEHFDAVLSTLMLHHLPRETRRQSLRETRRVLKPGGRLLAVDFGGPKSQKGWLAHLHRHGGIAIDDLVALVGEAGLDTIESGAVGVRDINYVLARR